MIKGGSWANKSVTRPQINHASRAPQIMSCNHHVSAHHMREMYMRYAVVYVCVGIIIT